MGACAKASAGSRGIAGPHCSPGTSGLGGKDRRWASAGKLRATAAPPDGDAWTPWVWARRGQKGGLVARGSCTVRSAAPEPDGPPALGTRRAAAPSARPGSAAVSAKRLIWTPPCIPHTLGRVEKASTASLRSALCSGNTGRKRDDGEGFARGAFLRACLSQINFPCTCFSSLCECVTLTPSRGLKIPGKGSAVLGPVSSVRSRAPPAWWSWGASATSGLGCLGLCVTTWGADRPGHGRADLIWRLG